MSFSELENVSSRLVINSRRLTIGLAEDVLHCLLDCDIISMRTRHWSYSKHTAVDGVGLLVWDLDAELLCCRQLCSAPALPTATNLLNRHDDLYGVETVKTEVVVEVRLAVELGYVSLRAYASNTSIGSYLRGILNLHGC